MKLRLQKTGTHLAAIVMIMSMPLFLYGATDVSDTIEILNRYTKDAGSQIAVKMLTEKKSIGTKTQSEGLVSITSGKINISLEGEKKSEMIYDGRKAYLISYPDMELDPNGKRKVLEIKTKDKNHLNLISLLFSSPKKFFSSFNITKKITNKSTYSLKLEDKNKELKPMTLEFSRKNLAITKISYSDDVDTEVTIDLEKPKFPKSISKNLFKYTKKKTDEAIVQ